MATVQTGGSEISVIVPVYNAEAYLRGAVESALQNIEVHEVILADDGSTDGSRNICSELVTEFSERVRFLRHSDQGNHGAGATRNLGIREARSSWISFLDADDEYTPERFSGIPEVLAREADLDGFYSPVGVLVESGGTGKDDEVYMVDPAPAPEDLFETLVTGSAGCFHTAGVTVKKRLLEEVGGFDEDLKLSQDFAMWLKLTATGKLAALPSEQPVAVYRRHSGNRSLRDDLELRWSQCLAAEKVLSWAVKNTRPEKQLRLLEQQFADYWHLYLEVCENRAFAESEGPVRLQVDRLRRLAKARPSLLRTTRYWKDAAWVFRERLKN